MELRLLERFIAVVDQGTLAAAARSLGLTQQALSASLASLEKDLDVRLFDRAPGGITQLTDYGRALVAHARSQIAADLRTLEALHSLANAESGSVKIGIGETFAGDVIAQAVTQIHQQRPGLRIDLIEGYSEQLLERLYIGEFDFVAVGLSGHAVRDGYRAHSIYSANDVVACRREHPLRKKRKLKLADLQGYTWLVPYSRPSDVDVITNAFVSAGLKPPDHLIGSDAFRIGMKLMAANDFLSMTSPAMVTSHLARDTYGVRILPIDQPSVKRTASLVLPTTRQLTPAAKTLLETVTECARDFIRERSRFGFDWTGVDITAAQGTDYK